MPECWFRSLPGAGECDGRLVRCHLIPRQQIKATVHPRDGSRGEMQRKRKALCADERCWVWGCGGAMGPGGHHGQFKPDGPLPIPRHRLPAELIEFAREIGLECWIDRTYPEVAQ